MDMAGLDYDTEEDDECYSPTCLDMGGVSLPTSRRHSTEKSPPTRKKRSVDLRLHVPRDSETDDAITGHWDDLEGRPQRTKPPNLNLIPQVRPIT
jgi:hypothetical protein